MSALSRPGSRQILRMCAVLLVAATSASAQELFKASYELEAKGRYAEAGALMEPLLKKSPPDEFVVLRYAWLAYLEGNLNDSIRTYRRALELNKESLDARLGVTLPLLAEGKYREAALYAKQVLAVSPWNYTAHLRLMACYEGEKRWEELSDEAAGLHRRYPSDATVLLYAARAEARLGHTKKAAGLYRSVLDRRPENIEATKFIASSSERN